MKTPKISVINPVYNGEKYLEYCIASILMQKYKDLEIIFVNDGSTDNSLNIIRKYALNDERIIIINQKNKGQSAARNTGLKMATGDWISSGNTSAGDFAINDNKDNIINELAVYYQNPNYDYAGV